MERRRTVYAVVSYILVVAFILHLQECRIHDLLGDGPFNTPITDGTTNGDGSQKITGTKWGYGIYERFTSLVVMMVIPFLLLVTRHRAWMLLIAPLLIAYLYFGVVIFVGFVDCFGVPGPNGNPLWCMSRNNTDLPIYDSWGATLLYMLLFIVNVLAAWLWWYGGFHSTRFAYAHTKRTDERGGEFRYA